MATRSAKYTVDENSNLLVVWLGITEADTGSAINLPASLSDISVQAVGDFTTSGAITLQGSNDGVNYAALDDVSGTSVVITASTKIWRLANLPAYVRPTATAGTAVAMDVYLHGVIWK